jgi:hypothetical protein
VLKIRVQCEHSFSTPGALIRPPSVAGLLQTARAPAYYNQSSSAFQPRKNAMVTAAVKS